MVIVYIVVPPAKWKSAGLAHHGRAHNDIHRRILGEYLQLPKQR